MIAQPVDEGLHQSAADGESEQEIRQHPCEGVGRRLEGLEVEDQRPRPGHLERQRHEAADEVGAENHADNGLGDFQQGLGRSVRLQQRFRLGRRRNPQRTADRNGQDRDEDVRPCGEQRRVAHTESLDQEESRHEDTRNGARGVQRIKPAHAAAHHFQIARDRPRNHRQCRTHQRRRDQQQCNRDDEAHEAEEEEGRLAPRRVECSDDRRDDSKQDGERQRGGRDAKLQNAIEHQRSDHAIGALAEQPRPERQAAHEGRQHGRDGVNRRPEKSRELARPDDLVNEPAGAAEEEHQRDQQPAALPDRRRFILSLHDVLNRIRIRRHNPRCQTSRKNAVQACPRGRDGSTKKTARCVARRRGRSGALGLAPAASSRFPMTWDRSTESMQGTGSVCLHWF